MGSRGSTFDTFAAEYDSYRPRYPRTAIDEVVSRCEVPARARVLEIGCATGQATDALAGRGWDITAVDPGEALLEIARSRHPGIRFVAEKFEDTALDEPFDFALAAVSFHWVDQKIGWRKLHGLLRENSRFVILALEKTWPKAIREDLDALYASYKADFSAVLATHGRSESRLDLAESARWFVEEEPLIHYFEIEYTPSTYLGLMRTMSDHRLLPDTVQKRFFADIQALCARHGTFALRNRMTARILKRK